MMTYQETHVSNILKLIVFSAVLSVAHGASRKAKSYDNYDELRQARARQQSGSLSWPLYEWGLNELNTKDAVDCAITKNALGKSKLQSKHEVIVSYDGRYRVGQYFSHRAMGDYCVVTISFSNRVCHYYFDRDGKPSHYSLDYHDDVGVDDCTKNFMLYSTNSIQYSDLRQQLMNDEPLKYSTFPKSVRGLYKLNTPEETVIGNKIKALEDRQIQSSQGQAKMVIQIQKELRKLRKVEADGKTKDVVDSMEKRINNELQFGTTFILGLAGNYALVKYYGYNIQGTYISVNYQTGSEREVQTLYWEIENGTNSEGVEFYSTMPENYISKQKAAEIERLGGVLADGWTPYADEVTKQLYYSKPGKKSTWNRPVKDSETGETKYKQENTYSKEAAHKQVQGNTYLFAFTEGVYEQDLVVANTEEETQENPALPEGWLSTVHEQSGETYYYQEKYPNITVTWDKPSPIVWEAAVDAKTKSTYYYQPLYPSATRWADNHAVETEEQEDVTEVISTNLNGDGACPGPKDSLKGLFQ